MSYDFHETVTLEMPDLGAKISEFTEAEGGKKALIVEVGAIHEGMTANHNYYGADALADAIDSWVHPYPKPIIMNHDMTSEPIGRVMAAKMDKEDDGTPFTRLQVAITDPAAIEKVLDKRYLTGSVGGKAEEALCSICNTDWSKASAFKMPCKHVRGKKYKVGDTEQVAHIKMNKISFKEYSVVNAPADNRSSFIPSAPATTETGTESDEWIRPARVFALNMDKEEIVEYTESENRNVLDGMKKKDASPLYLGIKGAFLSALAVHESEEDSVVEDEDILAVSEELSANLSAEEAQEAAAGHMHAHMHEDGAHSHVHTHDGGEFAFQHGDGAPHAHGHTEDHPQRVLNGPVAPDQTDTGDPQDVAPAAPRNSDDDEIDTETEEVEEENQEEAVQPPTTTTDDPSYNREPSGRPEAQEKPRGKDINSETSAGAPINRQSDEDQDLQEQLSELTTTNTELNEQIGLFEWRVAELETQVGTLSEENARLKTALKKSLVERVVDTKIALGILKREEREGHIEEHMTRTAASLADSLRDLATIKPVTTNYNKVPTVDEETHAIPVDTDKEGHEKVYTVVPTELETRSHKHDPEKFFTEVLLGKRKI